MSEKLSSICSAPDCDSPVKARGLCNAHYKRARRRHEFDANTLPSNPETPENIAKTTYLVTLTRAELVAYCNAVLESYGMKENDATP